MFVFEDRLLKRFSTDKGNCLEGVCITASGNILASGNLCFRVFKLQLKVINKNLCHLYSV